MRVQRHRIGASRSRRRLACEPVGPVLGWSYGARHRRHAIRRERVLLWQLVVAPGHHVALTQAGNQPRLDGRLDSQRLHRVAGHPG